MRYKQRGASYIGIFCCILLAAFAIQLSVSLFPPIWDDHIINKEIQDSLVALPKDVTAKQFKDNLSQRLDMNNIRDLQVDDILKVDNASGLTVHKDYEVRKKFFANVEFVVTFKRDFEQRTASTGGK